MLHVRAPHLKTSGEPELASDRPCGTGTTEVLVPQKSSSWWLGQTRLGTSPRWLAQAGGFQSCFFVGKSSRTAGNDATKNHFARLVAAAPLRSANYFRICEPAVVYRAAQARKRAPSTAKGEAVQVRWQPRQMRALDAWIARQPDPKPLRSEAIGRLIEQALAAPRAPQKRSERSATRAREMAGQELDRITDKSLPVEERESRKRRLTKGPQSPARSETISRRRRTKTWKERCMTAHHRRQGPRNNWRLILVAVAALAVIGAGMAYKFTGDFTGLVTFGTSGRQQPQ